MITVKLALSRSGILETSLRSSSVYAQRPSLLFRNVRYVFLLCGGTKKMPSKGSFSLANCPNSNSKMDLCGTGTEDGEPPDRMPPCAAVPQVWREGSLASCPPRGIDLPRTPLRFSQHSDNTHALRQLDWLRPDTCYPLAWFPTDPRCL